MIQINLHNYEEFFLLYADKELNAEDRLAVEQFVQANPDLGVELDLLLQLHLPADETIPFPGKNDLLRNESAAINLQNCEEKFLLYVDNELDAPEKEEVEKFVLQHPEQQQAFTLLKQTKSTAEVIPFPDKASLYREEKKEKPVFYMRWQRIAVAAAFIGAAVLVWTLSPREENQSALTAKRNTGIEQNKTAVNTDAPTKGPGASGANAGIEPITASAERPVTTAGTRRDNNSPNSNIYTTSSVISTERVTNEDKVSNDLIAKADPVTVMQRNGFETVPSNTTRVSGDNSVMEAVDHERQHTAEENQVKYASLTEEAKPAVYRELDTESADERKSLLLGSVEINKDKLRGFFRKAGSIFRGKGKAEEENTTASNTRSLK